MYYGVFRYVICQDITSGKRGGKAIERQVEIKSIWESPWWRTRTAYDTMSTRLKRHTHGMHAKLSRTHVWVGMDPFESNRVSLGSNQAGFGPVHA
jgi:hypothetical protein